MNTHYQGLGHIAIHTKDIGESIAFYEKLGGALHKQASMPTPNGEKGLALVEFGGFLLELIQSPVPVPMTEGNIPHFAVYVDDLDAAAAAVKAAGVDTFLTPERWCCRSFSADWKTGSSPVPPASRSSCCICFEHIGQVALPLGRYSFAALCKAYTNNAPDAMHPGHFLMKQRQKFQSLIYSRTR